MVTGFEVTFEDGEKIYGESVAWPWVSGCSFIGRSILRHPRPTAPHFGTDRPLTIPRQGIAVLEKARVPGICRILHENKADVQSSPAPRKSNSIPCMAQAPFRQLMAGPCGRSPTASSPTDLGDPYGEKMADPKKFRRQSPEAQESLLRACTKPAGAYGCLPGLKVFR